MRASASVRQAARTRQCPQTAFAWATWASWAAPDSLAGKNSFSWTTARARWPGCCWVSLLWSRWGLARRHSLLLRMCPGVWSACAPASGDQVEGCWSGWPSSVRDRLEGLDTRARRPRNGRCWEDVVDCAPETEGWDQHGGR